MILLLVTAGLALAQEQPPEPVPATVAAHTQVDDHIAQAEFFARKGWYSDAWAELQAAAALPGGGESFALFRLASEVAWETQDIAGLLEAARRAEQLAPDDDQRLGLKELQEGIVRDFGFVELSGPHEGLSSRVQVEPLDPQLDPELKRFTTKLSTRLRERTALPTTFGLPVGRYRVNGEEVLVTAGQTAPLELPMRALGARGLAALQVARGELSIGVSQLVAGTLEPGGPSPVLGLALSLPVGPVIVGLVGGGAVEARPSPGGAAIAPSATVEGGLRVGRELVLWGPLSLRPSLVYRLGVQPGIALDCTGWEGEQWTCAVPTDTDSRRAAVQTTSLAHRPGAEVAIDWRPAGRTTAFGTGVRVLVDQGFGRLSADGEATLADGSLIRWTSSSDRWTATRIQMLTAISLAF